MKQILLLLVLLLFVAQPLFAGQYDLQTVTPEIQQALDGRRERFSVLEQLKDEGKIGEGRDGLAVNFAGAPEAEAAVRAENKDRNLIYQAVLTQNHLPETEIHTIRRVFAETQRSKAKAGQMIQTESGTWIKK
ncbi:MAG: DUF1318 domain-containing protein [Candidatus Omnitrophica bacterium]|nr:DUF1318 domain-containing protein [Candidatus Omnitrophota bacterium]